MPTGDPIYQLLTINRLFEEMILLLFNCEALELVCMKHVNVNVMYHPVHQQNSDFLFSGSVYSTCMYICLMYTCSLRTLVTCIIIFYYHS